MPIYKAKATDLGIVIDKCYFDAEHGRTWLALARLKELRQRFMEHAKLAYVEAYIRSEYLGQGLHAHHFAAQAAHLDPNFAAAASVATCLASSETQFRFWADILERVVPAHEPAHQTVEEIRSLIKQGVPYHEILEASAESAPSPGRKAACLELLLSCTKLPAVDEVRIRRERAQAIRELDSIEAAHRNTKPERYPPQQRVALQEAFQELVRAMGLDNNDPELWNLRASWLVDLEDFREALEAAAEAIRLRPHGYPKPHYNRARALLGLERKAGAEASAREAARQAGAADLPGDRADAIKLAECCVSPPLDANSINDLFRELRDSLWTTCLMYKEPEIRQVGRLGWAPVSAIVLGGVAAQDQPSAVFVPWLAEVLGVYTPETAFVIMTMVGAGSREAFGKCAEAAAYLAANTDGVELWEATRLLSLLVLSCGSRELARSLYRQLVLTTARVAWTPDFPDRVREDLKSIMASTMVSEIVDQPPITTADEEYARGTIMARLAGITDTLPGAAVANRRITDDPDNALNQVLLHPAPRSKFGLFGCLGLIVILTVLVGYIAWLLG